MESKFADKLGTLLEHCGKCPGDPGVPDTKKGIMDDGVAGEPRGEGDVEKDIKPKSMFAKRLDAALDEDDRPEELQTIVPGTQKAKDVEKQVQKLRKPHALKPDKRPEELQTIVPGSKRAAEVQQKVQEYLKNKK